jgi:hypothetical protein
MPAQTTTPAIEIKDIAPPIDVFPYPAWMVITALAVALALLGLIAWLVFRWVRNRPEPVPPTPREIALASLNQARERLESLAPYEFSILVSDILRAYVAAQYQLSAKQQTSPEFLASIAAQPRFSESEKSLLAVFLEKCDLIKFARIDASSADSATLLEEAIRFVKGGSAA